MARVTAMLGLLILGGCTARHEWEVSILQQPAPQVVYVPGPPVRR